MGAVRGGSRKCLAMLHLNGDSQRVASPSAALGLPVEVRRGSGAGPARLPCGSYKPLGLQHLCRELCILRSSLFLLRFPPGWLQ